MGDRLIGYRHDGSRLTVSGRLATLNWLIAQHEGQRAHYAATSNYGDREWAERQARIIAERDELRAILVADEAV